MRNVHAVTGACDFDSVALGSLGVPAFQIRIDGSVAARDEHPAGLASPRGDGDDTFEIVAKVEDLRARHKSGLLRRQVSCEIFVKLRGIEIRKAIRGLFYAGGF